MNLKTTISGLLAALLQVAKFFWPGGEEILNALLALALALLGYFAKDA